ncbi:MAG: hypothetical protein IPL06_17530 [Betaproteobacteria bacterium]|nr:hypothetical protein [Betaproteobacteria bacterium]
MSPAGVMRRIRCSPISVTKTLPAASTASPRGVSMDCPSAGVPSGEVPRAPLPAIVVMMPATLTLRMREVLISPK